MLAKSSLTETRTKSGKYRRQARVLVVEDNARLRKLMADVLGLEGFAVSQAEDVAGMRSQMHDVARDRYPDEAFDLIVTDVQMPGENGLVALQWLRHRGCPTPALVVTAYPELATLELVRKLEAILLPKPFSLLEFRRVAVEAINTAPRSAASK